MLVLGVWAFSYERGTPVPLRAKAAHRTALKGYLAHNKQPYPLDHHGAIGIVLL